MAALAPGVLTKLVNGMNNGIEKPMGKHSTALLQVTDIVPADLDEKDLWPKHGFYIKVSDSSHSLYATLPLDQDDLVLSNKMQLGQFIYVDRLDPASPVPVLVGAKPLPGRHPLLGTPEPILRTKTSSVPRRGSWSFDQNQNQNSASVPSPLICKPIAIDFDEKTPLKTRATGSVASPLGSGRIGKDRSSGMKTRSSVSGVLLAKIAEAKETSSGLVRKSCIISKFSRSNSFTDRDSKIPRSPFAPEKTSNASTPTTKLRNPLAAEDSNSSDDGQSNSVSYNQSFACSGSASPKNNSANRLFMLPGKLSILGKEAMQQREVAQKAALQALRDATATETIVRILKMFSELSNNAKPEAPSNCFDQFLNFHQEVVQAAKDMEAIQAATSMNSTSEELKLSEKKDEDSVLQEIDHNTNSQSGSKRRVLLISKSVSFAPETTNQTKTNLGKHPRSSTFTVRNKGSSLADSPDVDENRVSTTAHCSLSSSSLKLAKKVRTEAAKWFMNFLEEALDSGLKKSSKGGDGVKKGSSCPQSLILRVINWVEMEQSESSNCNTTLHPKASQIARKLRIKAKNP